MSIADATNRTQKSKESDFYQTPEIAVFALAFSELFGHEREFTYIHDPCCGNKPIGNVLCHKFGYSMTESDISVGTDFLSDNTSRECIVMNPPYTKKNEFIDHAMSVSNHVFAILPTSVINYQVFHRKYLCHRRYVGRLLMTPKFYMTSEYSHRIVKRGGVSGYSWFYWGSDTDRSYSVEYYEDLDSLQELIDDVRDPESKGA